MEIEGAKNSPSVKLEWTHEVKENIIEILNIVLQETENGYKLREKTKQDIRNILSKLPLKNN